MNRRRFLIHSCSALAAAPRLLRAQVLAKPALLSESLVYKHPDENPRLRS